MTPEELAYRQRALQTFGSLEDGVLAARSRAIIGTDQLPHTPQGQLAISCLNKLRDGADPGPTPMEFAALEYMIRAMRPAPLVHGGEVDKVTDADYLTAFTHWTDFARQFPFVSASIGRISKWNGPARSNADRVGTGFLVAPGAVMTNIHVLDYLSGGSNQLQTGQAFMEFRCEEGDLTDEPYFDLTSVIALHPTQDACLLRVGGNPSGTPLSLNPNTAAANTQVAAVGFPYPDSERNPMFVSSVFGTKFGFKHVSPGLLTGGQVRNGTVWHDCSTLGGESGSPVLSLADCSVVGLHREGGFMWKNLAVDSAQLAGWVKGVPGV
jgi:hypothetical protein